MTCWWWVRHGPTHANSFVGWTDLPADLSDTAALKRLGRYLPKQALLVSSDLDRSIKTANAVHGARERLPDAPTLREMNFGEWEAKQFSEVTATHPDLSRKFWTTPGTIAPPGGESWNETAERVGGFVDEINNQHPQRDIIAVAHLGVILTQIKRASGMTAISAMSFKIDNLSVTRLEYNAPHWRVLGVNHLP